MGINAGVSVLRRITDERRWKEFLRAVIEQFKNDPRVKMEVKIDLDAPLGFSSRKDIQHLHLTESFNFAPGDRSRSPFWHTEYQSPNHDLYFRMGTTNDDELEEFYRLESRIPFELVRSHKNREEAELEYFSTTKFGERYKYFHDMKIKETAELKEATTNKLKSESVRLNYTDVDLDELQSHRFLTPPIAIKFQVGEYPSLPVYAHHFKSIESKISCGGLMADVALCGVYQLLKRFFRGHTQYWSELREEDGFPEGDRTSNESKDATDAFYRTLLESFDQKVMDN